jgi:uncharacterized protein involved in exopolysaccharide biosynthesis
MTMVPPRVADWLLQRLTSGPRRQSIIGDLHEQYRRGRSPGWYWRQTLAAILLDGAMKQRIAWLLLPTIVTAGVTVALSSRYLPVRYQSEAVILVVPQQVPEAYIRSMVSSKLGDRLQTLTSQILSRTRLERIILDLDLYSEQRKTSMRAAVEQMRSSVGVQLVSDDAFRVSFTSNDPRTSMRVAERLGSLVIDESLLQRETIAEGTSQFLETQIEDVRNHLVESEVKLRALRAKTAGELSQGDLIPYEVLKESYRGLLQKQLDARVGANLERRQIGEQFRILDPARLPEAPVGPSRAAVNIGGTLLGLVFGLVMVVVSTRHTRVPSGEPI